VTNVAKLTLERRTLKLALFLCALVSCTAELSAQEWPQFLGPDRNARYSAANLLASWPAEGPKKLWHTTVGQGFSGPVVTAGRIVIFHRLADEELVQCFDATNGAPLWTNKYPSHYRDDFGFDEGPRATPAIAGEQVFTYGAQGILSCTRLDTGKAEWSRDLKTDYQAPKGFFGIGCSPLVHGEAVILNVGGKDEAAVCAFGRHTGKTLWKVGRDETSYSSPVSAKLNGRDLLFCLTASLLSAIDPARGQVLFSYPFKPPIRASVSAASPVVIGDSIFISGAYDTGSALLRVAENSFEKIWAGDDRISNHYANSVPLNGFLYGIHGRADPGWEPGPSLRCVDLKNGKLRWEQKDFGAASLILAGSDLLCLTERGELIRVAAAPDGYKPSGRAQVLPNHARAFPALANGRMYARSDKELVCLELGTVVSRDAHPRGK
jgi:outer membrane protein assembly factor BamB